MESEKSDQTDDGQKTDMANSTESESKLKIPRPPNAFILFANEHRKIMAQQCPADSNKEISRKLGKMWKELDIKQKAVYFEKANSISVEHKKKYPEYVYNPKEARIRKAMREANRDRPMGPGVMLPRPSARRADWVLPRAPMTVQGPQRDDHLVMSPMNVSANPNCFPNEYAKMQEAHMQRPMSAAPAGYYQPNPLTQLQEHTDMWHNYHDDLRARNVTGMPGYMVPEMPYHHPQMASHHHHQPSPPLSIPSPLLENGQTPLQALNGLTPPHSVPVTPPFHYPGANVPITPPLSNVSMTPPHSNENVPPDLESQPIALTQAEETQKGAEFVEEHQKQQSFGSTMQPLTLTDSNIQQSEEEYLRAYNQGSVPHFEEKADDTKVKKTPAPSDAHPMDYSQKVPFHLPLSCTNFCTSPDLITNNVTYQKEYIQKYFQDFPQYNVLNFMAENGDTFPYATINNYVENKNAIAALPQPSFVQTDVGFIPVILGSCGTNHDFGRTSKMYRMDIGSN